MIEVELPDGRVIQVETDDPGIAASAARKYLGGPVDPAANDDPVNNVPFAPKATEMPNEPLSFLPGGEPFEPGITEDVARLATSGFQGFNKGVSQVAELPYDALNNLPRLANLLPGVDDVGKISDMVSDIPVLSTMFAGEDPIQNAMPDPVVTPNTPYERVAERAGEEVGATVLPAAGITARAAALPTSITGMNTSGIKGLFDRAFALPVRNAPVAANALEAVSAAGAGAGSQFAEETIDDHPLVQLLGGVAGGMAPNMLANTAGNTARTFMDILTDRQARIGTGEKLVKAATDPDTAFSEGTVNRASQLDADVPGTKVTTGQASSDPGVLSLEYSRATGGPRPGQYRAREASNNTAMRDALDSVAPGAVDDSATRQVLDQRRNGALSAADDVVKSRAGVRDEALTAAEPKQSVSDAGRQIRETAETGKDLLADIRDAEAMPLLRQAEESGAVVNVEPVVKVIDDTMARTKRPAVRQALEQAREYLNVTGTDTLDDSVSGLYETRKAVNDLIAGRAENSTGRYAKSELMEVRNALDDAIGEAAPDYRSYLESYRRGSAPLNEMDAGPVGKVTSRDKLTGAPDVPDSEVAGQFWNGKAGNKEALEAFEAQLGGNKPAREALRDAAMADALKSATKNGDIDPAALERWIAKNEDKLAYYPDIKKDLGTLSRATQSLRNSEKRAGMLADNLSDPKKSTIAKYLDTDEATTSMKSILSSKNSAAEAENLMRTVRGDDDAVAGVRRAFFDLMDSPDGITSTNRDLNDNPLFKKDAFVKFMNKNDGAARAILGDKHVDDLRQIAKQLDVLQQTSNIKAPGSSGTAQGNVGTGLTVNSVLSRLYGIQRGVVSPRFVVSEVITRQIASLARTMRGGRIDELLDEALLDPKLARTLVLEWSKENERLLSKRIPELLTRFGARAARTGAVNEMNDDEK